MKKIIILVVIGGIFLLLQKPDTPTKPAPTPTKVLGNCEACGGDGHVDSGDKGNPAPVTHDNNEYDMEGGDYYEGPRRLFRGRLFQ